MTVRTMTEFAPLAKEALRRASLKLSLPSRVVVEKGQ